MKTAIYIEDGVVQLVLTPENEFEKNALSSFSEDDFSAKIMRGSFYDCRGGWTRHRESYSTLYGCGSNDEDQSLIIRTARKREE